MRRLGGPVGGGAKGSCGGRGASQLRQLFCLVHGSTQTASGWSLVVRELQTRRHRTVSLSNNPDTSGTQYAVIAKVWADRGRSDCRGSLRERGVPAPAAQRPLSRLVFLAGINPQIGKSFLGQVRENPEMLFPDLIGKDPTKDPEAAVHSCSTTVPQKSRISTHYAAIDIWHGERWKKSLP